MLNNEQIKKALQEQGMSIGLVAKAIGVTTPTVSATIARKGTSKKCAKAICLAINKPIEDVFSDQPKYFKDDKSEFKQQALQRIANGF